MVYSGHAIGLKGDSMTTHLRRNQYRGVNAHLHSRFQRSGGWQAFHRAHTQDLLTALEQVLPDDSGYTVALEPSLQMAWYDMHTDESTAHHNLNLKTDLDDYHERDRVDIAGNSRSMSEPTSVLPVTNLFIADDGINAIGIRRGDVLVTRIELMSPACLYPGTHYYPYLVGRSQSLREQVKLVEIDYLHERRPPVLEVPDYTHHEAGSYPYSILVSEMKTATGPGHTEVYAFWVEEPIPVVAIPLADDEMIPFDFGEAYHQTFYDNSMNGLRYVDYNELPEAFETYSEEDRDRIKVRMDLVQSLD